MHTPRANPAIHGALRRLDSPGGVPGSAGAFSSSAPGSLASVARRLFFLPGDPAPVVRVDSTTRGGAFLLS